ncbi:hypothetical protein ACG83_31180 [Frankia sp. R43]|uniref:hypothetical protein n=1 Tax=Frankia sp. R43 TaxID=269536 RepID=UPI0006C9F9BF|nr:hypothetical protein [Frankia sp. R43]KPM52021.1 hypothetical protein ACG83_31180 [Frankia sp. R43]
MYEDEIARLRGEAEKAKARHDACADRSSPALAEIRSRLLGHLNTLTGKIDAPIVLGAVGEYNSLKSTVLSVLLGVPLLLESSENPTTGNVTVLRLRAAPAGSPARVVHAEVQFMSPDELVRCADHVLGKLVTRATEENPALGAQQELADYCPVTDGWGRFNAWCRKRLWADQAGDVTIKQIAMELVMLRDAQARAGTLLGRRRTITPGLVSAGVRLPLPAAPPLAFPEPAPAPATPASNLADPVADLQENHLREAFSLVRELRATIEADPENWPLPGLLGAVDLQIRDFPGFNAQHTQHRDLFVSGLGGEGIETFLNFVDTRKPAAPASLEFYALLRKLGMPAGQVARAPIVVATWFEDVRAPAGDGPLTLQTLFGGVSRLHGVCVVAESLTGARIDKGHRLDRLVLVSTLPAMQSVGRHLEKVPQAEPGAWAVVAERLADGDPYSAAARDVREALTEYARDCGISALRSLVTTHVRTNGLANRLDQLNTAAAAVQAALTEHDWEVARLDAQGSPDANAAQEAVLTLVEELRDAARELRGGADSLRYAGRSAPSAPGTPTAPLAALLDRAAEDALEEVRRWPFWPEFAQELSWEDTGFAVRAQQETPPDERPAIALSTQALTRRFGLSASRLVEQYHKEVFDAVDGWERAERSRLFTPLAAALADPGVLGVLATALSPERLGRLERLTGTRLVGHDPAAGPPSGLTDAARARLAGTGPVTPAGREPADAAPFPPGPHALPWNPGYEGDPAGSATRRHLTTVLRRRTEAVTAVRDIVQGEVIELAAEISQQLTLEIDKLIRALPAEHELAAAPGDDPDDDYR